MSSFILPKRSYGQTGHDSLRQFYVRPYAKQFFIGPVIKQRTVSFQLRNRFDVYKITFRPNHSYSAGIRLHVLGVGTEFTMAIPLATRNKERFGETEVTEFSFNSISKDWLADFYWQRYSGFYFERSWDPVKSSEVHPQLPDMEVINSGFTYTYIFNHEKFSIRSPYQFTEHQTKSRGSFLLGFIFSRFQVTGDSSIVHSSDHDYFGLGVTARSLDFANLSIMPGYSYNFIYKNFFLNLTALGGPAHYWINYAPAVGEKRYDIDVNFASSFRAAVGFNAENYFAGLSYQSNSHHSKYLEARFSSSVSTFRLLAGIRFTERGLLAKRPLDIHNMMKKFQ